MRFAYTLAAFILVAGICRADCANGKCSTLSRAATWDHTPAQTVANVATAPARVVARSTVHVRQTVQTRRLAVRHR